ncbi:metallophosphoesterase [Paenibacillus artemisiicola]|nr:metallophosphoesterase [Paenibacillus artemisiicola]
MLMLLLFVGLQLYAGWHAQLYIGELTGASGLAYGLTFWSAYLVLAFGYLLARLLRRRLPAFAALGLKWAGSYWIAAFQYSVLLLPFADLAAWPLRASGVSNAGAILYTGSAVTLLLLGILLLGSRNAWSPVVKEYAVTVPKPGGALKELRIAAASDLHLGTTVGRRHLERLVRRINGLRPDVALLVGDVLDDDVEPFVRRDDGSRLAQIRTPYGTYAVLGNHEYYGGGIDTYIETMSGYGIPVLLDETVTIAGSVHLIGRKDKTDRERASVAELTATLDDGKPRILMDHQPAAIREIADAGIDVSFHGHTHRGQMAPNHWITRRIFELDWGYKAFGALHAFVSCGFGTWGPPIRIGSRSEILCVTVRFDSQA